ncbi:MAG: DUF559 domain-containing protein [Candidatus Nanopelagicales bacterium]
MRGQAIPPGDARLQGGLFTRLQCESAGYSTYRTARLLRTGQWVVVLGSALAPAGTPLTPVALSWAAVLAAGGDGVASHGTAARLWGVVVPPDAEAHAIVPRECRVRVRGLRTHRVPLPDADVAVREGVPTTALVRTVVDCLLWLPADSGRAMYVDAQRRGLFRPADIRSYLINSPCRHGMHRAWEVLNEASGAYSEAEVRCHRLLRGARLDGWRANVDLYDDVGLIGAADVLFDLARVVIELDGRAYHSDSTAFQADRTKQNRLVAQGYSVLRFTWDDLTTRPGYVLDAIRSALVRAAA